MFRTLAVAAVSLVALTGCGGAAATTSTPSPTPDPGATYTRIVKPTNDASDALYAAIKAQPLNLPGIRTAATGYATSLHRFNGDLLDLKTQAPKAASDIDTLRKSVAVDEGLALAIVSSTDANIGGAILAANHSDGGAALLVRSDLGIPPPPSQQVMPSPSSAA